MQNRLRMTMRIFDKPLARNTVDDLTDALLNVMKYSDTEVEYPSIENVKKDDGVVAEWLYPLWNFPNETCELSAIFLYTQQETMYEEIGELMLGIALVEMKHYAKLSDLIQKLGGKADRSYNSANTAKVGKTVKEALEIALKSETDTIAGYDEFVKKLDRLTKETETIKVVRKLIAKIVADEEVHRSLLQEKLSGYEKRETNE